MSDFNITDIKGNKELVMEDECSQPVVMIPSTHSGDGTDRSNVKPEEDKTSSRSSEGFVMWRDLFWASGSEQVLHVVHGGHVHWGSLSMVRMDISLLHVGKSVGVVVSLSVFGLVGWLDAIRESQIRFKIMSILTLPS